MNAPHDAAVAPAAAPLPAEALSTQTAFGALATQALYVAAKLGIAGLLAVIQADRELALPSSLVCPLRSRMRGGGCRVMCGDSCFLLLRARGTNLDSALDLS